MPLADTLGRPLRSLRLSVTDRCNFRCQYCMPEADYVWIPREELLSFEELGRLVEAFASLGVDRVRLTGGEPLLRRDLADLVETLARIERLTDLALTTTGALLAGSARALRTAGLHRVTVSLDTLDPERFRSLTRSDLLPRVLEGIEAAASAGFDALKIDAVVIRGVNDTELPSLIEYGRSVGAEVRFIEYMDVGGATRWSAERVFSRIDMLGALEARYGPILPLPGRGAAPAERFRLPDGCVFGIVASTTAPFCRACDRSRLTADGLWYLCLYAPGGIDLRAPLRQGASPDDLRGIIASAWSGRDDRGAEQRLGLSQRSPLVAPADLRRDPHLEMHTRGG